MPTCARSATDAVTQFVYDPHVAPFIEALLAAHAPQRAAPIPTSAPVAVPTNSYTAQLSARRDRGVELRRRRPSSEHELREPLVERSERRDTINGARGGGVEDRSMPLIDLSDRVTSSQDAEVREVIFKIPIPAPSNSSSTGPSIEIPPPGRSPRQHDSRVLSPRQGDTSIASSPRRDHGLLSPRHNHGNLPAYGPESTTFSFLSLSQASSPELNHVELERLSFSGMSTPPVVTSDQWAEVHRRYPSERRSLEEDVVSLPETSTSGYEDAESCSPVNGAQSPVTIHGQLDRALGSPDALTERVAGQSTRIRGPMSVVSVSESEGWDDGDSDWEGMRGSMRM
jgi:hypothetical protein